MLGKTQALRDTLKDEESGVDPGKGATFTHWLGRSTPRTALAAVVPNKNPLSPGPLLKNCPHCMTGAKGLPTEHEEEEKKAFFSRDGGGGIVSPGSVMVVDLVVTD